MHVFYITTIPYLLCNNNNYHKLEGTVWLLLHGYNLDNEIYDHLSDTCYLFVWPFYPNKMVKKYGIPLSWFIDKQPLQICT